MNKRYTIVLNLFGYDTGRYVNVSEAEFKRLESMLQKASSDSMTHPPQFINIGDTFYNVQAVQDIKLVVTNYG